MQEQCFNSSIPADSLIPHPSSLNLIPESEKTNVALRAHREQVAEVFLFWREMMNHPRAVLDAKRKKLIEARMKDGYSVADLCKAIRGCAKSAWHMGHNDNGTKYDGLDLILRDGGKVDKFVAMDDSPPSPQQGSQKLTPLQAASATLFNRQEPHQSGAEREIEGEVLHG